MGLSVAILSQMSSEEQFSSCKIAQLTGGRCLKQQAHAGPQIELQKKQKPHHLPLPSRQCPRQRRDRAEPRRWHEEMEGVLAGERTGRQSHRHTEPSEGGSRTWARKTDTSMHSPARPCAGLQGNQVAECRPHREAGRRVRKTRTRDRNQHGPTPQVDHNLLPSSPPSVLPWGQVSKMIPPIPTQRRQH